MKNRFKKKRLYARCLAWLAQLFSLGVDDLAWLDMAPVGREFGSKDYERLEQLDALAEAAKALVDRASESIDDTPRSVDESNKRIQDMVRISAIVTGHFGAS